MSAHRLIVAVLASALALPPAASAATVTKAGTSLDNVATATYADRAGTSYAITSNAVTTTVAAVGSLAVGPKESVPDAGSEGYAPGATIVRTFTIVNTSNVTDAYVVTDVSADGGRLTGLTFTAADGDHPATIGGSPSPSIAPGASLALNVAIATTSATPSSFPIVVKLATTKGQTANGVQSDWGRAWAIPARAPLIAGPAGPSDTVSLFVGGAHTQQSAPGAAVSFSVPFGNWGGSPATNPVLAVTLPTAVHPDLGTVKVGGSAASGTMNASTLTVALPTIPVNSTSSVTFDATLDRAIPSGTTLVSNATLSATAAKAVQSLPATIFIGTAGIVFDAGTTNALPVPGASIALVDQATSAPIALDTTPRSTSANPTLSASDGSFGFSIAPNVSLATLHAVLVVHAPGFIDRRIGLQFMPKATPPLYTLTMTALDGGPLAAEGGFALVTRPVTLTNINGLFGNIPLFRANGLTVTLAADRAFASPGDRIVYTATYTTGSSAVLPRAFTIDLAPGLAFAPATARLDGQPITATAAGRSVSFDINGDSTTRNARTLATSPPGHTITAVAVVLPGTPPGISLTSDVRVAATLGASASQATASATADVRIIGGPFSAGGMLTGRVFLDERHSGRFEHGDHGVAGARIYLENGDSAVTDAQGRFSFFGVRPGMHVVRLDAQTLPTGVRAYDDRAFSGSRSLTRLVHGTLDSGLAADLSFAVQPQ